VGNGGRARQGRIPLHRPSPAVALTSAMLVGVDPIDAAYSVLCDAAALGDASPSRTPPLAVLVREQGPGDCAAYRAPERRRLRNRSSDGLTCSTLMTTGVGQQTPHETVMTVQRDLPGRSAPQSP
jgi:hypothetical protein